MTCLRFSTESEAITLMPQYRHDEIMYATRLTDGELDTYQIGVKEFWTLASHSHALDPIGTLYAETGEVALIDGIETKLTAPLPGWHMNFQGELPEELLPFVVVPVNPKVVWA